MICASAGLVSSFVGSELAVPHKPGGRLPCGGITEFERRGLPGAIGLPGSVSACFQPHPSRLIRQYRLHHGDEPLPALRRSGKNHGRGVWVQAMESTRTNIFSAFPPDNTLVD